MKAKKKNRIKTSTLKMLLVVEGAIIFVLVCIGIGFALWNWGVLAALTTPNAEPMKTSAPVIRFTPSPSLTTTIIPALMPTVTITSAHALELPPLPTLTLTALPTDKPLATASAELSMQIVTTSATQDLNFSLDSANTVPPDDIIHELGYYGGAGGGIHCDFQRTEPYILEYGPDAKFELMEPIWNLVCNLPPNQDVTETVQLPDGTTQQFVFKSSDDGELLTKYVASLESAVGGYVFSFDVGDIHLEETLNVIKPQAPQLYVIGEDSDEINTQRQIIFYNFLPNEKIRLFAYNRGDLKIKVWQTYTANNIGMIVINNNLEKSAYLYAAIGEYSGEVYQRAIARQLNPPPGSFLSLWFYNDMYCSNTSNSATDLSYRQYAEVIVDSLPAFDGTFKENLPQGKVVQVSGAFCKDHTWFVSLMDPNGEYVQEKDGSQVFLQPLDITATPSWPNDTPTPLASLTPTLEAPACIGTLPTRLHIGMNAQVTTSGKAPQLSLRAEPSMSAEQVHVIAAGRKMVIVEGPTCAEHSYWWYIRTEQGYMGWSREGDNEDYWIDPLP